MFRINLCKVSPRVIPGLKSLEFNSENRCLYFIQSRIESSNFFLSSCFVPALAQDLYLIDKVNIIGNDGTAITVRSQILSGIKTKDGRASILAFHIVC